MSAKSTLVDGVVRIEPQQGKARARRAEGGAPTAFVHFAGGAVGKLDLSSPRDRAWQEVLESLQKSKQLAYVELDPQTSFLTSLLLPQSYTVLAVRDDAHGGLELELEISHAVHRLTREHPRFQELRTLLIDAMRSKARLLVTESIEDSTIVDVRPAPPPASRGHKRR
jgi:hypothetical protein